MVGRKGPGSNPRGPPNSRTQQCCPFDRTAMPIQNRTAAERAALLFTSARTALQQCCRTDRTAVSQCGRNGIALRTGGTALLKNGVKWTALLPVPTALLFISYSTAVPPRQQCCSFQPALLFISVRTAVHFTKHCCRLGQQCCSEWTALLLVWLGVRSKRTAVLSIGTAVLSESIAVQYVSEGRRQ